MLEEKIISQCANRHRMLERPAQVAATSPDTQVKIYNKSAYYVIKDCANITLKYLPHFVYSEFENAKHTLKGKLSEDDIIDFIQRSSSDIHTRQLLQIILSDIVPNNTPSVREPIIDFSIQDGEDVYGDYDFGDEIDIIDDKPQSQIIDLSDSTAIIDNLKSAFL